MTSKLFQNIFTGDIQIVIPALQKRMKNVVINTDEF